MSDIRMNAKESGDGWIRKVPLLSGRAVFAEFVQWSVSESAETPRNALEAAVWRKSVEVDYAREKVPFLNLRARVMAVCKTQPTKREEMINSCSGGAGQIVGLEVRKRLDQQDETDLAAESKSAAECGKYAALWVAGKEEAISTETATTFDGADAELMWRAGDWSSVSQVQQAVEGKIPVVSADIVAHPYQIFRARDLGADAIVVMLAVFSVDDMAYQLKAIRSLGMASVVEVNTPEEYSLATSGPLDKLMDFVMLADRDIESDSLAVPSADETMTTFSSVSSSFAQAKTPVLLLCSDTTSPSPSPPGIAGLIASKVL